MLDPTGPAPGAVPPHVLSALRGDAETRSTRPAAATTPEQIRTERALARLDGKLATLAALRSPTPSTPEAAFQFAVALLEVGQAALAAYLTARDGAEAQPAPYPRAPLADDIAAMAEDSPILGFLRPEARP